MKENDAVRVNTPTEPAHDLIGHITSVEGSTGYYWVYLKETGNTWKYLGSELVAVQPEL